MDIFSETCSIPDGWLVDNNEVCADGLARVIFYNHPDEVLQCRDVLVNLEGLSVEEISLQGTATTFQEVRDMATAACDGLLRSMLDI